MKTYDGSIPQFVDERVVHKIWIDENGRNRAFIYKNSNGTWGMWSEYFSSEEMEMCWIGKDMGGHIYDSEETATQELMGWNSWASNVEPQLVIHGKGT